MVQWREPLGKFLRGLPDISHNRIAETLYGGSSVGDLYAAEDGRSVSDNPREKEQNETIN